MELSADLVDENFFRLRLMRLMDCVKTELAAANGPELCWAGLMVGGIRPIAPTSGDACGTAWVGMLEAYPSASFPLVDVEGGNACNSPWAMRLEIGVARAYPRTVDRNAFPDPQEMFNATRLYLSDMRAIRRALTCCWKDPKNAEHRDWKQAPGSWTTLDPAHGKSGGVLTAYIG